MSLMSSPVILVPAFFGAVVVALFFLAAVVLAMFGSLFLSTLWLSLLNALSLLALLLSLALVVSSMLVKYKSKREGRGFDIVHKINKTTNIALYLPVTHNGNHSGSP
jgi:hypothetical protein